MDNKVFNVNGRSKLQLQATLKLAMLDEYDKERKAKSWKFDPNKGLILQWSNENGTSFPIELSSVMLTEIVWEWLQSKEAKSMLFEGWDANADHDGDNELGFRVYCEDWGHVGGDYSAIIAIRPSYCWYGK